MSDTPRIFVPESEEKPSLDAVDFDPANMRPCEPGDIVFLWTPPIFGIAKYLRADEVSGHWVQNWVDTKSRKPHKTGCDKNGFLRCFLVQQGIIENFGKMAPEDVQAEMERQDSIQIMKQQAEHLKAQLAGGGMPMGPGPRG